MKKLILLLLCLMSFISLVGCSQKDKFIDCWADEYADTINSFTKESVNETKVFYDGAYLEENLEKFSKKSDIKYEFVSEDKLRFVNSSDGYAVTFPSKDVEIDYSLSKYRVQAKYNDTVLTISYEHSNPYGNSKISWFTYKTEWITRYIDNEKYLKDNNLEYSSSVITSTDIINGYEVITYPIHIKDSKDIEYPYYNISIVRQEKEYIDFYLFVSKSTSDQTIAHQEMLKSFKEVKAFGVSDNYVGSYEMKENPLWNSETKAYYNYLLKEDTFDFGFFRWSLADDTDPNYRDTYLNRAIEANQFIKDNMNYDVEIQPTYTHIGWYDEDHYFPTHSANTIAGGNGFNGKPVLQFTFQFTRNNNNVSTANKESNYTPMFDILRGNYDEYFKVLAKQVKDYGKPVLFRLNNEMNTDWTSYSGIMSLLDPDIFRLTWIRMYEIFDEEGVDNCIWIFNPISKSCPYSSWGEDLCYMPGVEYVQALGLTHYEMQNDSNYNSFTKCYSGELYQKNKTAWANYPWIISEFGCGSGGDSDGLELYRYSQNQAKWVEDLFNVFSNKQNNEFASKICAAVWFNCNDVAGDSIVNALNIDNVPITIKAFKEGFEKLNKK